MWGSTGRGCHLQAVLRAVKLLRAWQGEGDLQHTLALTLRVPKSTPGIRKTGWAHHSLFSLWQNSLFPLNLGIPNILDIYLQVLIPRECRAACRLGKKQPFLSGVSCSLRKIPAAGMCTWKEKFLRFHLPVLFLCHDLRGTCRFLEQLLIPMPGRLQTSQEASAASEHAEENYCGSILLLPLRVWFSHYKKISSGHSKKK